MPPARRQSPASDESSRVRWLVAASWANPVELWGWRLATRAVHRGGHHTINQHYRRAGRAKPKNWQICGAMVDGGSAENQRWRARHNSEAFDIGVQIGEVLRMEIIKQADWHQRCREFVSRIDLVSLDSDGLVGGIE